MNYIAVVVKEEPEADLNEGKQKQQQQQHVTQGDHPPPPASFPAPVVGDLTGHGIELGSAVGTRQISDGSAMAAWSGHGQRDSSVGGDGKGGAEPVASEAQSQPDGSETQLRFVQTVQTRPETGEDVTYS